MSRLSYQVNENILVPYGFDNALGRFIQIIDLRFEGHAEDHQGEGFVCDWDDSFGFTPPNHIGITETEIKLLHTNVEAFKAVVIHKCDLFIKSLPTTDQS
jgi:hypothetical protein